MIKSKVQTNVYRSTLVMEAFPFILKRGLCMYMCAYNQLLCLWLWSWVKYLVPTMPQCSAPLPKGPPMSVLTAMSPVPKGEFDTTRCLVILAKWINGKLIEMWLLWEILKYTLKTVNFNIIISFHGDIELWMLHPEL